MSKRPSSPRSPLSLHDIARQQVKAWLDGSNVTQVELSHKLGHTQMWVSRYLNGELNADMDTLAAIATTFGHDFVELFRFPEDAKESSLIHMYRAMRPASRELLIRNAQEFLGPPPRKRRLVNTHRMAAFANPAHSQSEE